MKSRVLACSLSLSLVASLVLPPLAFAATIDTAVIDTEIPTNAATVTPGATVNVAITCTVNGPQRGVGKFEVPTSISFANGSWAYSSYEETEVPSMSGGDKKVYNFAASITAPADPAPTPYSLVIVPIVTQPGTSQPLLHPGTPAAYQLTVEQPPPADTTPPTVGATLDPAPAGGWNNSAVKVTLAATDDEGGSGVSKIKYSVDSGEEQVVDAATAEFTLSEDGNHEVKFCAVDQANNECAVQSQAVNIDKTAPTISGAAKTSANTNGWYNSDVVVHFDGSDTLSGIDALTPDQTVSVEGAGQSVKGTATDKAGNSADYTVSGINIDKTAPTITSDNDKQTYTLNEKVNAAWSVNDSLSGGDTDSGSVAKGTPLDTSTPGKHSFTVTATDRAGNAANKTVEYSVVYVYGGILQPVNADGSSVFKAGSTVPIKFQLKDAAGALVCDPAATLTVNYWKAGIAGDVMETVSTAAATTGNLFRYDASANQHIFNLSTKNLKAGNTYLLTVKLSDGTPYGVLISLK